MRTPELVCRRDGVEWAIFLRVPPEAAAARVLFGGVELHSEDGEYRLPAFRGTVTLVAEDGQSKNIPVFDGTELLVFRLSGSGDSSFGRWRRRIGDGRFLVIAPKEEERRGSLEPDDCSDRQFLAHFVTAKKEDGSESLGTIGKWPLWTGRTASLKGKTVPDSSDEGDLFVEPPMLESTEGIECARIGEEPPGDWKGQNLLARDGLSDVLAGRCGRFFLRTYRPGDTRADDSTSFRYWPDLRDITVDGQPFREDLVLVPSSGGTEMTRVQLVGETGPLNPKVLSKHARFHDGVVAVAPTPEGDDVELLLQNRASEMNVVVNLPRVWWRLSAKDDWTDQPIRMTRTDFASADKEIELLTPVGERDPSVGLEGQYRTFPCTRDERFTRKNRCLVPFASFRDWNALGERMNRNLRVQLRLTDGETTLLVIRPDPPEAQPPPLVEPIDSSDSGRRVFRGVIVRRKVFAGVVLEASADGVVRIVWGKKRHKRVIQRLLPVLRIGNTIPRRAVGIFYRTKVVLQPAVRGTGVMAPHPVKAILELSGVRDARATTFGPNDPLSLIKATVDGLAQLPSDPRTHAQGQRR